MGTGKRAFWFVDLEEILGMDDRTWRRESGACSVILVPLLFDIDGYLKGYAGGLVVFRLMSLHIGLVAKAMIQVSASLFGGSRVHCGTTSRDDCPVFRGRMTDVQGSTSRIAPAMVLST